MYYHLHLDGNDSDVASFRRAIAGSDKFLDFEEIISSDSKITKEQADYIQNELLCDLNADAYNHVNFNKEAYISHHAWGVDSNVKRCGENGLNDLYFIVEGTNDLLPEFVDSFRIKAREFGVTASFENRSPSYGFVSRYYYNDDLKAFDVDKVEFDLNEDIVRASYFTRSDTFENDGYTVLSDKEARQFGIDEPNACLFSDGFVCSLIDDTGDTLKVLQDMDFRFKQNDLDGLSLVEDKLSKCVMGERFVVAVYREDYGDMHPKFAVYDAGIGYRGANLVSHIKDDFLRPGHPDCCIDMYLLQKGSDKIVHGHDYDDVIYGAIDKKVYSDVYQMDVGSCILGKLMSRTNGYRTHMQYYNESKGDGSLFVIVQPGIEGYSYELETKNGVDYRVMYTRSNRDVAAAASHSNMYDYYVKYAPLSKESMALVEEHLNVPDTLSVYDLKLNNSVSRNDIFMKYKELNAKSPKSEPLDVDMSDTLRRANDKENVLKR